MSKLLVVFGATGNQGRSVIDQVLAHPTLSKTLRLRGITRDASKPDAQALRNLGVEVVSADASRTDTLKAAFAGASSTFIMTTSNDGVPAELAAGKALVDAAVVAGVSQIIFSSLPHVTRLTNSKYPGVGVFDVKADIEEYIRAQPVRSAFFNPASFMQNFHSIMMPRPDPDAPGAYAITGIQSPNVKIPLIDIAADSGKWVVPALADPEKYDGSVFCASSGMYSAVEVAAAMSKASGKTVTHKHLPVDVFSSFLPPGRGDALVQMFQYQEEFGYYGADQDRLVKWAADNAVGKLTSLDEYFARCPLLLE